MSENINSELLLSNCDLLTPECGSSEINLKTPDINNSKNMISTVSASPSLGLSEKDSSNDLKEDKLDASALLLNEIEQSANSLKIGYYNKCELNTATPMTKQSYVKIGAPKQNHTKVDAVGEEQYEDLVSGANIDYETIFPLFDKWLNKTEEENICIK